MVRNAEEPTIESFNTICHLLCIIFAAQVKHVFEIFTANL